ncbi:MAG TPA: hypothetical protein VHO43_16655 [Ignavibacteriales bacterium]|nr:hypothetical protein [Ignavibacteriales bacterium]
MFNPVKFCIAIILISSLSINAQIYRGLSEVMFLMTQPNARAEALGGGNAALSGSPFMSFYNPAASSFSGAVTAEASHLEFPFLFGWGGDKKNYETYGIGVNMEQFGAFSFNYLQLTFDPNLVNHGDWISIASTGIFMMNYSYPVLRDFSVGVNANYYEENKTLDRGTGFKGWYYDLGLMKKFNMKYETSEQNLCLGLSFLNLLNSKVSQTLSTKIYGRFPSTMRLAASYEFQPVNKISDFRTIKALLTAEYRDLLNSRYRTQFQLGTEVTFLEMFVLRGGFHSEELNNWYSTASSRLNQLTYGFGIAAPVKKLSGVNIPLNIKFDYTSLPFPEYYVDDPRHEYDCPIYTMSVSYSI